MTGGSISGEPIAEGLKILLDFSRPYFWLVALAFVLSEVPKLNVALRMDWRQADPNMMHCQSALLPRMSIGQKSRDKASGFAIPLLNLGRNRSLTVLPGYSWALGSDDLTPLGSRDGLLAIGPCEVRILG